MLGLLVYGVGALFGPVAWGLGYIQHSGFLYEGSESSPALQKSPFYLYEGPACMAHVLSFGASSTSNPNALLLLHTSYFLVLRDSAPIGQTSFQSRPRFGRRPRFGGQPLLRAPGLRYPKAPSTIMVHTSEPWEDPNSGSTLNFYNLHHRSIGVQNWGFHFWIFPGVWDMVVSRNSGLHLAAPIRRIMVYLASVWGPVELRITPHGAQS